jgi:hypothetical protein
MPCNYKSLGGPSSRSNSDGEGSGTVAHHAQPMLPIRLISITAGRSLMTNVSELDWGSIQEIKFRTEEYHPFLDITLCSPLKVNCCFKGGLKNKPS